jgi:hypothetical protein
MLTSHWCFRKAIYWQTLHDAGKDSEVSNLFSRVMIDEQHGRPENPYLRALVDIRNEAMILPG